MHYANYKIVTHSGTFHADESLAVYMLKSLPRFSGAELIRTRDEAVISEAGIVVDVGAVYDPQRLRFDHHQRGFEETFSADHTVKLSSAGLIYKHFGREMIAVRFNLNPSDEKVNVLYNKMYDDFILAVIVIFYNV
jgi:urease accessory protein